MTSQLRSGLTYKQTDIHTEAYTHSGDKKLKPAAPSDCINRYLQLESKRGEDCKEQ